MGCETLKQKMQTELMSSSKAIYTLTFDPSFQPLNEDVWEINYNLMNKRNYYIWKIESLYYQ